MEFSSEVAVLQSAIRFATSKLGNPIKVTDKKDVDSFVNMISPSIQEILDGLEDPRTLLDRNVCSFKLLSFLFTHILKEIFSGEQIVSQLEVEETAPSSIDGSPVDENRTEQILKCPSFNTVYQHIPCLSFPVFLELVKTFKWNDHFLECLEIIDKTKAVSVIKATLDTANQWLADTASLEIMVTCLKYHIWLVVQSANENPRLKADVSETFGSISKWLSENLGQLTFQELFTENQNLLKELTHLLVLLGNILLNGTESDLRSHLKNACKEKEYPKERETTKVLCMMEKVAGQHVFRDEKSFVILLSQLQTACPRTEWIDLISKIVEFNEEGWNCDSEDSFCGHLAREGTLSMGLVDVDMEVLCNALLNILKRTEGSGEVDERTRLLMRFLESVDTERSQQKAKREKEEEERKGMITLNETLKNRLSGYEDGLERLLSCCSITTWQTERYLELLTENSDLLFLESHVCLLHQTLKKLIKQKDDDSILQPILQILLGSFSKLPILIQEKIILDNFLAEEKDLLSSIGNFHQEMNVAFNQFTSEASEKQLQSVLRLCLVDPVSVMENAVTTAVKSPGQIPVVLKIFHSVPDLCRCSYGNHHPERSLLCHVTSQFLLENSLSHNEEKNFIKFIAAANQSFDRELCGYKLQEAAILSAAEFASAAILPFIGVPKSADEQQPISIEFSLKLFICLLEKKTDKGCDWLIELQLQTLLLCLCELLHECVGLWDSSSHVINKCGVKQLCLRCLHVLQTKCTGIFSHLHSNAADWLKSRTKALDWSVLIHLQKTLCCLGALRESEYSVIIDSLAQHVTRTMGSICLPILRYVSIADETLEAAKKCLGDCNRVIPPDVLTTSLTEVLPNLLLSECRRVVCYLVGLIQCDRLALPYTLMFSNKIVLTMSNDIRCLLSLSQLLSDIVIATSVDVSAPASAVRHVVTCYVTSLQEQSKILGDIKDRTTEAFLIGQIFGHVAVAMTTMDVDQSEPLFVYLLSLLDCYINLRNKRVSRTKGRESLLHVANFSETDETVVKAVALLDDENWQETLLKKMYEKKGDKWQ